MNSNFEHIFGLAKKHDRKAQKTLYDMFSAKMLAIAKSYTGNLQDAEDVLLEAFYKCFTKINDCKDARSFPFWLRKIVVNDAINFIRKNKNLLYADTDNLESLTLEEEEEQNFKQLNLEEIFSEMPVGYKVIFNLFVFEEKKHSEIAEILNITEGTSKSQLNKAKKWLVECINSKKEVQQNVE